MNKIFYKTLSITVILLAPLVIFLFRKQKKIPYSMHNRLLSFITKSLQSSSVPKINVEQASENKSSYIFLDSREKEEYNVSHIKDSVYVGDKEFNLSNVKSIPKDANIIVYCAVGVRSDRIAKRLIEEGYINVHNLFGGIFEWINEGNPVFNPSGYLTPYIHAYSKFWGTFLSNGYKLYGEY